MSDAACREEETLEIPELCLVVLVGPSGSGKSTFAAKHFAPTEIVSSDRCRGLVADDENDQRATAEAFELLGTIARLRLRSGRLTVIDATSVRREDRAKLVALAREQDVLPVALVFDLPPAECQRRNRDRADRQLNPRVVRQQSRALRQSLRGLKREGFRHVRVLREPTRIDALGLRRVPLWNDRRGDEGPFDIIGDVHGCAEELVELLAALGYRLEGDLEGDTASITVTHPEGRRAIFLGDLVDRGPATPRVLRLAMAMHRDGVALCVPGNHEAKLLKALRGRPAKLTHGLGETLEQLDAEPNADAFKTEVESFIDGLISHYVLDGGRLVVAHAGLKEAYQGRASGRVRSYCLFGETTGETDSFGLPERVDWAADYRGQALVVFGHTPLERCRWLNRTVCIDTGCVFGGALTALRYPERELVEVKAKRVYWQPTKPLESEEQTSTIERPEATTLSVDDVLGKQLLETRFSRPITVRAEQSAAALEPLSRFAIDPRWLIYLPPTMSPAATCSEGDCLEHPRECFAYYREQGQREVICEQKHMGSRAVVIVARDGEVLRERFGLDSAAGGVIYTRRGRAFFSDASWERALLETLRGALDRAGTWERFDSRWFCIDAELLPWSAKAQDLLRHQYAPTGAAARRALATAEASLRRALDRHDLSEQARSALEELEAQVRERHDCAEAYVEAYRHYCWPVDSPQDLRLAPFHLLASEGRVHHDQDHVWHMEQLAAICAESAQLIATPWRRVDLEDAESEASATAWWESLTGEGGEGMVVKPLSWLAQGKRGLIQPALKCRGREYLRIIYGPEYTRADQLERLRSRGLGRKRSLALREYTLGLEGLVRFVEGEPLYRVHRCAAAVLALESDPVDPRL